MARDSTRLEDLARIAGVSTATASRALSDHPAVNSRTKQLIWQLAKEHRYPFRRGLPKGPIGATGTIALVVPRPQGRDTLLDDPFILELFAGVGDAARERGCDLVMSHFMPAGYQDLAAAMTTSRADGIIFLGQSSLHAAFNQLARTETRFAVWGAQLPDQAYCSIGSDNLAGGRRATLHLARMGRRRIVYLGENEAPEVSQRVRGYREAMEQSGLPAEPELMVPTYFTVESGEAAVDALLARGIAFDAIVAASDLIALGAIRSLLHHGVRVPEDVSVVGYDDVPFARFSRPALTTVVQNTARAGRMLVSKLLDTGADSEMRSERLPTDLIVRESCGG
jgi:DNA-binding LacI/PurR family transcriptional regulator